MQSQREKVKKAIEMLKKGTPVREIGKELRLSYSTICLIRKRMALHEKEKTTTEAPSTRDESSMTTAKSMSKGVSKHSQGLQLLVEKKSLVEISILLDLETNEVLKIFNDFLILQKMEKVAAILIAHKNNLDAFINLQSHILKNNIDIKKIWSRIGLEQEYYKLSEENKTLKFERDTAVDVEKFWKEQFDQINGKYQNLLRQVKRKRLISVQHAGRSHDSSFE